VALPGPAEVRLKIESKIFDASIRRIMIAPILIGAINGNVMLQNVRQGVAPSISADKNCSFGRLRSPANKIRNINGVHCQTSAMVIVTAAGKICVDHAIGSTPNRRRKPFTAPISSLKIERHTIAITLGVVISGTSHKTLKNLREANPFHAYIAAAKPRTYWSVVVINEKYKSLNSDAQKLPSWNMRAQLAPPAQSKPD